MESQTVVGVFNTVSAAEQAKTGLLGAGVPEDQMVLSADMSEDGIAAEAPGQAYENQPGQSPEDSARAGHSGAVRSGACVLSVGTTDRANGRFIAELMRQNGARRTFERAAARP